MAKGPREGTDPSPCTNEDCRVMTRPNRQPANKYPYPTKPRRSAGLCSKCHERVRAKAKREGTLPPAPAERTRFLALTNPDPYTVAGLNSFINRRRARQPRQRTSEHSAV